VDVHFGLNGRSWGFLLQILYENNPTYMTTYRSVRDRQTDGYTRTDNVVTSALQPALSASRGTNMANQAGFAYTLNYHCSYNRF